MDSNSLKQYVVFKVNNEEYGVDIQKVIEIERMVPITRVPNAPHYIKGVINLRGEIIPVIGLRERFNLKSTESTDKTRIIIFKINDAPIGGIVDEVLEVIQLSYESIESVSNFSSDVSLDFIYGVGKVNERIITLLNLDKLIDKINA